jgi:hypothetical protein
VRIVLLTCITSVLAIVFFSCAMSSHPQYRDIVLSIDSPRPLADAAAEIETTLGVSISYEDAALIYSGDYARALDTEWGRKWAEEDSRFRARNPLGLIGGSLELHFVIDPVSRKPIVPVHQILQNLIDQHKARANPGEFKLLTVGDGFSIVPGAVRDTNGLTVPEHSPLDFQISFPLERRSGMATLETICQAVTAASGRKVTIGVVPLNLLMSTAVELGADRQTTRDVLLRALEDLRWNNGVSGVPIPKMSWHLLYGHMTTSPSLADGSYALNVQPVR